MLKAEINSLFQNIDIPKAKIKISWPKKMN